MFVADMRIFAVVVCRLELEISRSAPYVFVTCTLIDICSVVSLSVSATARIPGWEERFICSADRSYRLRDPLQPSGQCVLLVLYRGLKRTEHELGHPHACGVHVKNVVSSKPAPPCFFATCAGIILRIGLPI